MSERDVQKAILQFLALKKVKAIRRNVSAIQFKRKDGSDGFMRNGMKGEADIEAWTRGGNTIWIECKGPKGKQSDDQAAFQREMESMGHIYLLVRDVSDLFPLFGKV